jgi:hypothetical protein
MSLCLKDEVKVEEEECGFKVSSSSKPFRSFTGA